MSKLSCKARLTQKSFPYVLGMFVFTIRKPLFKHSARTKSKRGIFERNYLLSQPVQAPRYRRRRMQHASARCSLSSPHLRLEPRRVWRAKLSGISRPLSLKWLRWLHKAGSKLQQMFPCGARIGTCDLPLKDHVRTYRASQSVTSTDVFQNKITQAKKKKRKR